MLCRYRCVVVVARLVLSCHIRRSIASRKWMIIRIEILAVTTVCTLLLEDAGEWFTYRIPQYYECIYWYWYLTKDKDVRYHHTCNIIVKATTRWHASKRASLLVTEKPQLCSIKTTQTPQTSSLIRSRFFFLSLLFPPFLPLPFSAPMGATGH